VLPRTYPSFIAAACLLAGIMASFYSPPEVSAHRLTSPLANGVAGPYDYVVGIWPPDPSVGNLFMSITLLANQQPVTNAVITVTTTMNDGPAVVGPAPAINNFLHPQSYELSMTLSTPGRWTLKIEIESPLGDVVVEVPLEITESEEAANNRGSERAADLAEAGRDAGSQQLEGDGLHWVKMAAPLAILGFGLGVWGLRRFKRPSSLRNSRQRIRRDKQRGRGA